MVDQPQVQMRLSVEELEALDQVRTVLGERTYGIVPSRGELAKVAVLDWIAARQREFSAPAPEDAPASAPAGPVGVDWTALDRAAVVALGQTLRHEGLGYHQIASRFNAQQVPTVSGRGRWSGGSVERLLHRSGLQEG